MRCIAIVLLLGLSAWSARPSWAEGGPVRVVNPRITTDSSIDCSSVDSVLAAIIKPDMTDEQKALACWRFMLDHYYHWWPPDEADGGGNVRDFAKAINSYGFGPCFVAAPVQTALWDAAGLRTRCWTITGHTIPEVFYGGAWHLIDPDARGWHRKADGQIASVEELAKDLKLFTEPAERSDPYYPEGLPYETHKQYEFWGPASKISDLYASTKDNYRFNERAVYGHPMFVNLRPGETLTLNYGNVGQFVKWAKYPEEKPNGPQEEVRRKTTYGNGTLVWKPDLNAIPPDDLFWGESRNVKLEGVKVPGAIYPADPSKPAVAVFRVFCPWVMVKTGVVVRAMSSAGDVKGNLELGLSTDGGRTWDPVASCNPPSGAHPDDVGRYDVSGLTAGRYEYMVRITLRDAVVFQLEFNNTFQLAPLSLPRLKPGKNIVTVFRGPDRGVVQLVQAGKATTQPDIITESKGLLLAKGITPARPDQPGYVVYKLSAPAALKALCVGANVTLDYGRRPKLDAEYSLDAGATWQPAFAIHGNTNNQNAQFERNARINLADNGGQPSKEALIRFTLVGDNSFDDGKQYCGVNAIRLYGYYDLPQPDGARLKVDLAWTETAGQTSADKSRSLVVDNFPTTFDLTCGGDSVRLKSITLAPTAD